MGNLRNEGARPDVPSVFRRPAPWQSELPPTDRRQRGNIRPDGRQPDRALGQTAGTEVEIRPSLRPWWPRRSPARPTDLLSLLRDPGVLGLLLPEFAVHRHTREISSLYQRLAHGPSRP